MADRHDAFLRCPACGGALLAGKPSPEGEHFFEQCADCQGVWVEWWTGEASGIARRVPERQGATPAGERGGACPRDGTTLIERPYLDTGPVVERCPTCLGLFAPREQTVALARFHERIVIEAPEPIVWVSLLSRFWHAFVK